MFKRPTRYRRAVWFSESLCSLTHARDAEFLARCRRINASADCKQSRLPVLHDYEMMRPGFIQLPQPAWHFFPSMGVMPGVKKLKQSGAAVYDRVFANPREICKVRSVPLLVFRKVCDHPAPFPLDGVSPCHISSKAETTSLNI
jgi:hypothetical protein